MNQEEQIQREIVKHLDKVKVYYFSCPNENAGGGKGAMIRTRKYKAMGLRSGVSDLIVLLPNRIIFLEVKTPTGTQSPNQKKFHKKVIELGFEYFLVRSVDDVAKIV